MKQAEIELSYSECKLFSTIGMRCPLCGVDVPANEAHSCSSPKQPRIDVVPGAVVPEQRLKQAARTTVGEGRTHDRA